MEQQNQACILDVVSDGFAALITDYSGGHPGNVRVSSW